MRYIGSKVSVIQELYRLISERICRGSLCDPFGGIGTVGSFFKSKDYEVYSGDHLTFPHSFQIAKIAQNSLPRFDVLCNALGLENSQEIIKMLNSLKGKSGWLFQNYANQRGFFTLQNGGRIEACRQIIKTWRRKGWLTYKENAILIASLINSMDRVANTAGTYYAYLKNWYRKALKPFEFELLSYTPGNLNCKCFLCDAVDLVKRFECDILYLDPPYNERSYADYYHLPETIANDRTAIVRGKSGIPDTKRLKSAFNQRNEALEALENILDVARFRLLVFHYSDDGILSPNELKNLFYQFGYISEYVIDSVGYTNKSKSRLVKHRLYLVES